MTLYEFKYGLKQPFRMVFEPKEIWVVGGWVKRVINEY